MFVIIAYLVLGIIWCSLWAAIETGDLQAPFNKRRIRLARQFVRKIAVKIPFSIILWPVAAVIYAGGFFLKALKRNK